MINELMADQKARKDFTQTVSEARNIGPGAIEAARRAYDRALSKTGDLNAETEEAFRQFEHIKEATREAQEIDRELHVVNTVADRTAQKLAAAANAGQTATTISVGEHRYGGSQDELHRRVAEATRDQLRRQGLDATVKVATEQYQRPRGGGSNIDFDGTETATRDAYQVEVSWGDDRPRQ